MHAAWADGESRAAVVDDVEPGEWMRFRWWDADGVPSEVEWRLEDAVAGTRLIVLERALVPVAWAPRLAALHRASALALA